MPIDLKFSSCEAKERSSFLVRRYLTLRSDAKSGSYCDKHIPEGSCTLIFNFKGEVDMSLDQLQIQKLPPYFLTLPYPGYINIQAIPPIDTFGVVCRTSVFSAFFQISFDKNHTPSFCTVNDVIPQELWYKLKDAPSFQKRIEIFEEFIRLFAKGKQYDPDNIDVAYERIYSSKGLAQVQDLISDLTLNSRSFRRNFYRRVGISAKSLCRIVRAVRILQIIQESDKIDFQNMVFLGKYVDQPHFVNDFRKFVGESPGSFFHRDLKMVKILSGL